MIMNVKRYDVAIVGAGPAGSAAAICLAQRGYSVALLEKSLFPRDKLCGDFLNPVNWEIFAKLGVEEELLASEHEKVFSFRLSTPAAEASVALPAGNGRRAFGLGLRRSRLDDLLLKRAEKAGATVRKEFRINSLSRDDHGWGLSESDGADGKAIRSRLLIGADGRNSWVAHRLGLAHSAEGSGRYLAFQLHLRGFDLSSVEGCRGVAGEVQIHLFAGGYAGLVGLGGGIANLCFTIEKTKAKESPTVDFLLSQYLYGNPHLRHVLEGSEIVGASRSVYPLHFSPRRCFGDGFLLAGDAAQVTEPVTGEGVYLALKSGELAAAAFDSALKKRNFSARQLSSYDSACRRAFGRRRRLNRLIRGAIYRPYLLTPLLKLPAQAAFPVGALVRLVCQAPA